ncbi:MAG: 30S ribosomal protein THX [Bacteroidales bacterium]
MGKGDKKTKRGKIILGSSGIKRPKNKKKTVASEIVPKSVKETVEEKPAKKTSKKDTITE